MRKRARNLENDIDVKLVSYSKLGTSLGRKKGPEVTKIFILKVWILIYVIQKLILKVNFDNP